MTAMVAWGWNALAGSALLMALVLAVRAPVRRWVGPQLAYLLWVLPVVRLAVPPLPVALFGSLPLTRPGTTAMTVLFTGPQAALDAARALEPTITSPVLFSIWLGGAAGVAIVHALCHAVACRRLRSEGHDLDRCGRVRVIAADVDGPLAFGVIRKVIAVPRGFITDYDAAERDLAIAHEAAHHARGDLLANWLSLGVLAAHWWNPLAWVAIRAFRDDQELATDAHVLGHRGQGARAVYATVLVKASGIGALPACNLTARSNLKGRLMILKQARPTRRRLAAGGIALTVLGGAALAATAIPAATAAATTAAGAQAVTIGVKPDGKGRYALIVGGTAVAPGAALPGGATLPADFSRAGGCDLSSAAKPSAMVIKGEGATRSYTVMCASAAAVPVRATLAEGLASLKTMRASIATQPATTAFPEAERTHALGAVDRSIDEVEATLAAIG